MTRRPRMQALPWQTSALMLIWSFAHPPPTHEPMPAQLESSRIGPGLPSVSGADGGGVVEGAVFFFLLGQLGEFGVEWVRRCEHGFLAVEDRRVGAGLVVEAIDFAGAEREFDAAEQGAVGGWFRSRGR